MSKNRDIKLVLIRLNTFEVKDLTQNVLKTKSCYWLLLSLLCLYSSSAATPLPPLHQIYLH